MMMKNNSVLLYFVLCPLVLFAQNDNDLNRSVTVERDFQPVIQSAGKVATKPVVVETTIEPAQVEYSDYTAEVTPGVTINPLLSQPTRFAEGKKYNGYVRGALGHPNTLFDFGYRLNDGKKSTLDVYAHHRAQWGLKTLSRTKVGMNFTHNFADCDLYFGVNGGNVFYHKYGHFYDYSLVGPGAWIADKTAYPKPRTITDRDKTNLWTAEAFIGIKSNAKQDVQYNVQTGYMLFAKPNAVAEHQIRTQGSFDWHSEAHHVGMNFYMQNNFLQLSGNLAATVADTLYNSRHNLRMEPYYAYNGRRVQLHVGVNLDMNIGRGRNGLSATDNISFAPSPHVHLEAQIAPKWLTLYADATGSHGKGTLQAYMEANRYRLIHPGIISHHTASHTPVDAELGFHIKPYRDLFIELHGGYALMLNCNTLIAVTDSARYMPATLNAPMVAGDFSYTYCDYGRGKVGAQVHYHYRDYVRIKAYGDYYFWSAYRYEGNGYQYSTPAQELQDVLANTGKTVYDRASWEAGIRVDGQIDKHWSLYSDNRFVGSRLALASDGEHRLKPVIDLNLGLQYAMWVGKAKTSREKIKKDGSLTLQPEPQPNLTFFFQLNNWLHRKNDIYYGYQSQGINFLLGATFRF